MPTDFLTYSLESSFNVAIRLIASSGLSLKYGVECNFHPNYEYSQLQVYEFNDQTGFVVEYAMTSDSELVDLTLQLEFLYNNDGYKITSVDVDPG